MNFVHMNGTYSAHVQGTSHCYVIKINDLVIYTAILSCFLGNSLYFHIRFLVLEHRKQMCFKKTRPF